MALHTHFDLPIGAEPRRIHNRRTDIFNFRSGSRQLHVFAARSVASLAIDTQRDSLREYGLRSRWFVFCRHFRNTVMAEHATVCDRAREAGMIGPVVTGIHPPRR